MFKKLALIFSLIFFSTSLYAEGTKPQGESDQQISDFSLAGFAEKGKKSWDLAGKTADIFDNVIKLKDVVGNMYGATENVKLTANKGDFDKAEGKVHLEDKVVITSSSGAKLTTESLDWDRKNQLVSTKEKVNIEKENMTAIATGATGQPNLNKVNLVKDVQVEISAAKKEGQIEGSVKDKTIITCDGPLEVDYQNNIATFKNNVKVDNKDALIYSDIMDVYFAKPNKDTPKKDAEEASKAPTLMGSKIEKLVARGNVKIIKGENISYSDEATYLSADKKIILTGKPKLVLYSTDDLKSAFSGN
jgi:LPS export ABC transporter protein LptC